MSEQRGVQGIVPTDAGEVVVDGPYAILVRADERRDLTGPAGVSPGYWLAVPLGWGLRQPEPGEDLRAVADPHSSVLTVRREQPAGLVAADALAGLVAAERERDPGTTLRGEPWRRQVGGEEAVVCTIVAGSAPIATHVVLFDHAGVRFRVGLVGHPDHLEDGLVHGVCLDHWEWSQVPARLRLGG